MTFNAAKLSADLQRDESFSAVVYDDATGQKILPGTTVRGNPTLGIGWNVARNPLSIVQAQTILGWHITATAMGLFAAIPWAQSLDEVRCRALVNMAFNLGVPGLLEFHDMLAALQQQRWDDAAIAALRSKWATQVGERAKRIAEMFKTGQDAALIA